MHSGKRKVIYKEQDHKWLEMVLMLASEVWKNTQLLGSLVTMPPHFLSFLGNFFFPSVITKSLIFHQYSIGVL